MVEGVGVEGVDNGRLCQERRHLILTLREKFNFSKSERRERAKRSHRRFGDLWPLSQCCRDAQNRRAVADLPSKS